MIPDLLGEQVARFRSVDGAGWFARLPDVLAELCRRWRLAPGAPFTYPTHNYVARVTGPGGEPCVLKVGFILGELASEIDALRAYDGRGAVRLLDADADQGALLMERAEPGAQLLDLPDDDAATLAAADLLSDLWRPATVGGANPTLERWTVGLERIRPHFNGGTGPLPERAVDVAIELRRDLLASAPPSVLLHGDFQHYNILSAHRRPWLAIDPKGVVGEPAYEAGAFVRNRLDPDSDSRPVIARRLGVFADRLSLDLGRLKAWAAVDSVLSAWWCVEDSGDIGPEPLLHIEATMDVLSPRRGG